MRRVLRRLIREEHGFSLVELSAAMILSGLIAASLISVFYAMSQNSGDLSTKANVQATARGVVAEQVVEIRQAIKADLNGVPVEELDANTLIFYTQNYVTAEIERTIYERTECVEGRCELWVHRYAFDSTDGITTTFQDVPYESSFLMGNVMNDQPMFVGVEYVGDPLVRTETTTCDTPGTCDFPIIAITLRARPAPTTSGASTPVELREEVRIRSA